MWGHFQFLVLLSRVSVALALLTIPMFRLWSPMAQRLPEVFSNLLLPHLSLLHSTESNLFTLKLLWHEHPKCGSNNSLHIDHSQLTLQPIMLLPAPYWSRTLECVRDTMQSSFYNLHLSPKPILISGNGTCTYLYPPISPICKPMFCFTSTFSSPLASLPRWQCPLSSLCSAHCHLARHRNTWPQ